jgi:orotidine-5'-phosphate decarboxylase
VAAKLQLACFERLGAPGWAALERTASTARDAGLLVIADGKRGDVPVTALAYGQALFGSTPTPWGDVPGLRADAATANPILGADALEPLLDQAHAASAGLFCLVRTSNPGAADLLDLPAPKAPLFERLANLVAERADRLGSESGLSGMGAVVGATEPRHLARLRELMPSSIFLVPGVGAQGGRTADLAPALGGHPASVLVTASRSIANAPDPAAEARELRAALWELAP